MWDLHAHVIPPAVLDAAQEGRLGMNLFEGQLSIDGHRMPYRTLTDLDALKNYSLRSGLNLVLSVPPGLFRYQLSREDAKEWSRLVNGGIQQIIGSSAGRYRGFLLVPLQYPDLAAQEWKRHAGPDWLGVVAGTSINGHGLEEPPFLGFWEIFEEYRQVCFVHAVDAPDSRLGPYYLSNLLGYPYEDTWCVARLLFSGLPIRFAQTRWCISHGGGGAAALLGRWQWGYETQRPGIDRGLPAPREIFQKLWFDCLTHDAGALRLLLEHAAPHHVVAGSDYPFPMGMSEVFETPSQISSPLSDVMPAGDRLLRVNDTKRGTHSETLYD